VKCCNISPICNLANVTTCLTSGFGERQKHVGVPSAIETKGFIQFEVTRTNIKACSVNSEQFPTQVVLWRSELGKPHDHRHITCAPVRAAILKKIALALETQAE
jgi:hypothetical protein